MDRDLLQASGGAQVQCRREVYITFTCPACHINPGSRNLLI
jgi:hypothetical protein